jgi:hypothetical protein
MPKPALLVILSDTHIGGFTSVAPPEVQIEAGQIIKSNAAQAWLYGLWLEDFQAVKKRAAGCRVIVVHDGDVIEGEHHEVLAHLPDIKDQETLAVTMLTPWRNLADKFSSSRARKRMAATSTRASAASPAS